MNELESLRQRADSLQADLAAAMGAVRKVNQDRGWDDLSDDAQEAVAAIISKARRT